MLEAGQPKGAGWQPKVIIRIPKSFSFRETKVIIDILNINSRSYHLYAPTKKKGEDAREVSTASVCCTHLRRMLVVGDSRQFVEWDRGVGGAGAWRTPNPAAKPQGTGVAQFCLCCPRRLCVLFCLALAASWASSPGTTPPSSLAVSPLRCEASVSALHTARGPRPLRLRGGRREDHLPRSFKRALERFRV